MSHQLQRPIAKKVMMPPIITPARKEPRPPPVRVTKTPPQAVVTRATVKTRWPLGDLARSCLRKIGNRPKISIENSVKENTCVVDGNREASTADAIMAELVDMDAGRL